MTDDAETGFEEAGRYFASQRSWKRLQREQDMSAHDLDQLVSLDLRCELKNQHIYLVVTKRRTS